MSLQDKMNMNAKPALNSLKTEVANELGLSNYEQADKGNLTARQNGYVGGYMTKKLVEMAERQLSGNNFSARKYLSLYFLTDRRTLREQDAPWAFFISSRRERARSVPGRRTKRARAGGQKFLLI